MSEVERYLDVHPMAAWDRNQWSERDAMVDTAFHEQDVFFTPLANYTKMPSGVGFDQYYYTGTELVPAHQNTDPIGRYARFIDSIYVDTRQRRLQSTLRYGGKAQWDKKDSMVTRYMPADSDGFIKAAMNAQLLDGVKKTHETIARNSLLNFAAHKFLADGNVWTAGTYDFSTIAATDAYKFNIKILEDVALRMSIRCEDTLKKWGSYAQPVPNKQFRDNVLIMVPTSVMWDLWNSEAKDWLIDLRQLSDERIINGGKVQYRNMTVVDYGPGLSLWNAGTTRKQVNVTSPIKWGDGAVDPDASSDNMVDSVWLVGQSSADITHYVQCSSFSAGEFAVGDFVALHTARTSDWGVTTTGVDFTDGETQTVEVSGVDATNDRLTFRKPITYQYDKEITSGVYAYITKARHIYPVYIIGSRGMMTWAGRSKIEWRQPTDNDADFPSVERVTWEEFGEMNRWNPDIYEVAFCAGSFANRGAVSVV